MATQPSPSPFAYRDDRTIADANGVPLARCYADRNEAANGPLFATAPALLTRLETLVFALENGPASRLKGLDTHLAACRAAIAKARGEVA